MLPTYPQHIFFKFVQQNIPNRQYSIIVDCPCGSGYITYRVANSFFSKRVIGVDIDPDCIKQAIDAYKGNNLEYEVKDIHFFLNDCEPIDIYLLINSIFLLPAPAELLKKINNKLKDTGKFAIVIPNINSDNFKNFQRMQPHQNKLILDKQQAISFFETAGFRIESVKGLAFTMLYGNKILQRMWKLKGIYTYTFNFINELIGKKPSYWGFILSKM